MTITYQPLINQLISNGIQIIDIHVGDSTCFILKFADIKHLHTIPNDFPQFTIIEVLSSISSGYQYLFIK